MGFATKTFLQFQKIIEQELERQDVFIAAADDNTINYDVFNLNNRRSLSTINIEDNYPNNSILEINSKASASIATWGLNSSYIDSIPIRLDPKLQSIAFPQRGKARVITEARKVNELLWLEGKVLVEVIIEHNLVQTLDALHRLNIKETAAFGRIISIWVSPKQLTTIANLPEVHWVRPVLKQSGQGGIGSTQTDAVIEDGFNDIFRNCSIDGAGVTVGVMADSYNTLSGEAAGIASGDLPGIGNPNGYTGSVVIVEESVSADSDEGRATIEIIHDLAPATDYLFHTARGGVANYAQGVADLVTAGADIIVSDYAYFSQPFFQDGIVSQSFETSIAGGVPVIVAAGNLQTNSYESAFIDSGQTYNGETAHDFDPGPGVDIMQTISIDFGASFFLSLQWDDPWFSLSGAPGADTDLNIYLLNPTNSQSSSQETDNIVSGDPSESFSWNNGTLYNTYQIVITKAAGPDPGLIKYILTRPWDSGIDEYATNSATIIGTQNSENLITVGGTIKSDPNNFYRYSSEGGTPILFDAAGNRILAPVARFHPVIIAPQAVNTSFYGSSDLEGDGFPNFWGTSAAAPHVAGLAALIKQCNPTLTPSNLRQTLIDNAVDVNTPGYDVKTGYGYWSPQQSILDACPASCPCSLTITSIYSENCTESSPNNFITDWKIGIEILNTTETAIAYQRNREAIQTHTLTGTTDTLTISGIPADGGAL